MYLLNEHRYYITDNLKNRQSMTARGYCCCYLEHCSKTNHIAIKGVIQQATVHDVCTEFKEVNR